MRYILVPGIVDVTEPLDPSPSPRVLERITFAQALTACLMAVMGRQGIDTLEALDLRNKIVKVEPGQVLELTEPEYKALEPEIRKPTRLSAAYVLTGGAEHIRAFLDARTDNPRASSVAQA